MSYHNTHHFFIFTINIKKELKKPRKNAIKIGLHILRRDMSTIIQIESFNFLLLLCLLPVFTFAQGIPDSLSMEEMTKTQGLSTNLVIEEEITKTFASDFAMTMEDGNQKKLSDFRGKVVYLSFWASWCGVCIKNFNKYEKLREKMDSIGVVLLNVSIDKDPEKWKAFISKKALNGLHAIVPHNEVKDLYQMYHVPRYEIIGKNGEFLYLSDEPGRDVLENFKKFLEQD